jgi:hypothetical protein
MHAHVEEKFPLPRISVSNEANISVCFADLKPLRSTTCTHRCVVSGRNERRTFRLKIVTLSLLAKRLKGHVRPIIYRIGIIDEFVMFAVCRKSY